MNQPRKSKINQAPPPQRAPARAPVRARHTIDYRRDKARALTSDELGAMDEVARRDPELSSLLREADRKAARLYAAKPAHNPTAAAKSHGHTIQVHEEESDGSENEGVEAEEVYLEEEDEAALEAGNGDDDDGHELMDRGQLGEEEYAAETEDQGETEEWQEEEEDMEHEHTLARNGRHLDDRAKPERNGTHQAREERNAHCPPRRAPSRTPSYGQGCGDDGDETECGSIQDEDEQSVCSEEQEEFPTDPNIIEELSKFQSTFRGIEKRFRLINKIGEGRLAHRYALHRLTEYICILIT